MTYVLIIIVHFFRGDAMLTQEFSSKETCEAAIVELKFSHDAEKPICVKK